MQRISQRKNWGPAKKAKYLENLVDNANGDVAKMKVYEAFTKSGEVYTVKNNDGSG